MGDHQHRLFSMRESSAPPRNTRPRDGRWREKEAAPVEPVRLVTATVTEHHQVSEQIRKEQICQPDADADLPGDDGKAPSLARHRPGFGVRAAPGQGRNGVVQQRRSRTHPHILHLPGCPTRRRTSGAKEKYHG